MSARRKTPRKRRPNERGIALILVLGSITLLTVFLTQLQEQTSSALAAALAERDALKAEYYARSGVNLSRLLIAMEPEIRSSVKKSVLGMVLGQGMRMTAAGLVLGVAASFALTRLLQAQLFNVKPTDPATLSAVVLFIAIVAACACCLPAGRATRVDPMVVLRDE